MRPFNMHPLVDWALPPRVTTEEDAQVNDIGEALSEPCLNWSQDGERVVFAISQSVSVVIRVCPLCRLDYECSHVTPRLPSSLFDPACRVAAYFKSPIQMAI